MKLALILLLLLGAIASLGTLLPQGQPPGFYVAYYGESLGKLILLLSLDHLYRSWWFLALAVLLALNLLACSARRIKKSAGWKEWGSIVLHLSLLVILTGAVISGAMGRNAYVEIGVGDSVDLASHGFPGQVLTVREFRIEYYENLEPKQYISDLLLKTDEGGEIRQEIRVNYPLKFKGLKIYQKSYGWLVKGEVTAGGQALPFELSSGQKLPLDENNSLMLFFIPDHDVQSSKWHSLSPFPRNPKLACALIQDHSIVDMQIVGEKETKVLKNYPVTFLGYRYYTGLEIKKDPGVSIVYLGFGLLLLGFVLRYLMPDKTKTE